MDQWSLALTTQPKSTTESSLTRSFSILSLNVRLGLDVLRSKVKDLKAEIAKISEVLELMSFDDVDDETDV